MEATLLLLVVVLAVLTQQQATQVPELVQEGLEAVEAALGDFDDVVC